MKGYIDSVAGGINLTTWFVHKFPSHNGCIFHIYQTIHCVLSAQYFLQKQNRSNIIDFCLIFSLVFKSNNNIVASFRYRFDHLNMVFVVCFDKLISVEVIFVMNLNAGGFGPPDIRCSSAVVFEIIYQTQYHSNSILSCFKYHEIKTLKSNNILN